MAYVLLRALASESRSDSDNASTSGGILASTDIPATMLLFREWMAERRSRVGSDMRWATVSPLAVDACVWSPASRVMSARLLSASRAYNSTNKR